MDCKKIVLDNVWGVMDWHLFEKAKQYISSNKLLEAIKILENLKIIEPDNADVLFELGKSYLISNDNNNAILNLQQSIKLKENIHSYLLCIKAFNNIKEYRESLKLLFILKRKKIKEEVDKEILHILIEKRKYLNAKQYVKRYLNERYAEFVKEIFDISMELKEYKRYKDAISLLFILKRNKLMIKETDKEIVWILIEKKKYLSAKQYVKRYLNERYAEFAKEIFDISMELKEYKRYKDAISLLFILKRNKLMIKETDKEIVWILIEKKKYLSAKRYIVRKLSVSYNGLSENILNISRKLKELGRYREAVNLLFKIKRKNINEKETDKEIINIFLQLNKYVLIYKYIEKYSPYFLSEFIEYLINKNMDFFSDNILLQLEYLYWELYNKKDLKKIFNIEIKLLQLYLLKKKIFRKKQNFINKIAYKMNNTSYHFYYNNILNRLELFDNKIELLSKPLSLSVVLTNKCDIQCMFCNQYEINWTIPDNIRDEIMQLIPYLFKVSWLGGEVFLYKNFEELFNMAKKYNLKQEIITNSMLLNNKWLDRLLSSKTSLAISIRSFNEDKYEMLCNGAKFKKLIENLEYIRKNNDKRNEQFKLLMYILVTKYNYMDLEELAYYAKYYGFDIVRFIQLDNIENSCKSNNICDPSFECYNDFIEIFNKSVKFLKKSNIEIRNELPIKVAENKVITNMTNINGTENIGSSSLNIKTNKINSDINYKEGDMFCEAPWISLSIGLNGRIKFNSFCLDSKNIGNIKNNNIHDVWNSLNVKNIRKKIAENRYDNFCNSMCIKYKVHQKGFSHHCMPIKSK